MEEESDGDQFLKINGVWVDQTLFTRRYDCDVSYYGCNSQCCYRGCLLLPEEIPRIQKKLPLILPHLSPEKKNFLSRFPFYKSCARDCPVCEAERVEKENLRFYCSDINRLVCTQVIKDQCIFIFNDGGILHCSLHTLALSQGWKLNVIKPLDCIQFPLAIRKHQGEKYLYFQKVKALCHLPCLLLQKPGPPMYQTLKYVITTLLGEDFYRSLGKEESHFNEREMMKCRLPYLPS